MLWYMMKTWAGGEENLVKEIRRTVPPYLYSEAFVIYNERNWRHQGQSIIGTEPLFRGCAFLTCRETEPLFRRMERIPAMSRLMAGGYLSMFPLMEKDARFLEAISGKNHVVRVSYVLREEDGSSVYRISGALEQLADGIEKIRFSSRIAKTHRTMWGKDVVLPLGFVVNEDIENKVLYGDREVSIEPPNHWMRMEIGKDETGKNVYHISGRVTMLPEGEPRRITVAV